MKKESMSYRIFTVFNWILMLFIVAVCAFPYLNTLAKALNDGYDTMLGGITIFPRKFTWQNFSILFQDDSMYSAAFVSVMRVIISTVGSLFVQFSAAYALSRQQMIGRKKILLFLAIPMWINGGMIAQYLLYANTGMLNNFLVYILPTLFSYYNMIILKSYIESSVPDSLAEAAALDGANEFKIMWRIVFPLCKPVVATVCLWIAVGSWNNWIDTMYYITDPKLHTLQYKLMELVKESERMKSLIQEAALTGQEITNITATPESMVAAQVIITTIPIIILYPFLQKYFVKGVVVGAVK